MKKTYQTPWLQAMTMDADDIIRTSASTTYTKFGSVQDNNSEGDSDYVTWKW